MSPGWTVYSKTMSVKCFFPWKSSASQSEAVPIGKFTHSASRTRPLIHRPRRGLLAAMRIRSSSCSVPANGYLNIHGFT